MSKNFRRKSVEEKKEEVKRYTEQMEKDVENYFHSPENLKDYLSFMARFYHYTPSNSSLIQQQFPGAQGVGSFKFWQDKGFHVNKGEKGIKIFVPRWTADKFKDENGKWKLRKNASVREEDLIKNGKLEAQNSRLYFVMGSVFDVSQTNATEKDLPDIFPNRWMDGEVKDYRLLRKGMERIAANNGIKIVDPRHELGAAKGAFYPLDNEIELNPRNSELQNTKTLLHELAHAKLHTRERFYETTTPEKEFQAEMTAYAVSSFFGIDTSDHSLKYLHSWNHEKEIGDKKQLLSEVRETSMEFIETIEDTLMKEKQQEREERQPSGQKNILLIRYDGLSSTTQEYVGLDELKQRDGHQVDNADRLSEDEFLKAFNEQNKQRYTAVKEDDINQPHALIQWSEHPELPANRVMPFEHANKQMGKLETVGQQEGGYYKTRYHLLVPKEFNEDDRVSVVNMDRLDLGDGHYKNPLEQVLNEKPDLSPALKQSLIGKDSLYEKPEQELTSRYENFLRVRDGHAVDSTDALLQQTLAENKYLTAKVSLQNSGQMTDKEIMSLEKRVERKLSGKKKQHNLELER